MNILDYILMGVVFLYALLGAASGMFAQCLHLLGIIIAMATGALYYHKTKIFLFVPLVIIATIISFKLITYFVRKIYFKFRETKPKISFGSRIGGSVIGGFKGGAIAFIVLIVLHLLVGVATSLHPAIPEYLNRSYFYSHLKEHNLLPGIEVAKNVYYASKIFNEDLTEGLPLEDKEVRKLMKNRTFKSVIRDKEIQQNLQERDYTKVFSHPKFIALLKDKEFLDQICSLDYEKLYHRQLLRSTKGY